MGKKWQPIEVDGQPFVSGIFVVDKPVGVSSFSIVRKIRSILGIRKVGHAGTLDPFASGILVVCAGREATRNIDLLMQGRKTYRATIQLGVATTTLDPEGEIVTTKDVPDLSLEAIEETLAGFVGVQMQKPPHYSALKHNGKPLYHYARQGIMIDKPAREIEIFSIKLLGYAPEQKQLEIEVECGKGTYIRTLAADIAASLGSCGHLVSLRRTVVGDFSIAESVPGSLLTEEDGLNLLLAGMLSVADVFPGNL